MLPVYSYLKTYIMATPIDLAGDRGKENIGRRVIAGIVYELGNRPDTDLYRDLVTRNQQGVFEAIENYVLQLGDRVARVMFTVNDYRGKLGVGLVSLNVEAQGEDGSALNIDGDVKSPTLGLVEPVNSGVSGVAAVGFEVDEGQAEQISSVSNMLRFGIGLENRGGSVSLGKGVLRKGGDSLTVVGGDAVVAELPVLNKDTLDKSGLPYMRTGRIIECPPQGDQVYFCRYLTAEAARRCVED